MINLTLLISLSTQGRDEALFGFNGNLLETNVINLAAVVGIVVYFGGDALRSLLLNRKQSVLSSLQEADLRLFEAEDNLSKARSQLSTFEGRAAEIRHQASGTALEEREQSVQQTQESALGLERVKHLTQEMQQQRTMSQASQEVVSFALIEVRDKLRRRLSASTHVTVNRFYGALLATSARS